MIRYLGAILLAVLLTACGGGGGSPGATTGGGGDSSTGGGTQTTTVGSLSIDVVSGAGVSTNSISAVEIAQARVLLKDGKGAPVPGVVVTFSEVGGPLLAFAPLSATALTDSGGAATIEVRAASTSGVGATTVAASSAIAGTTLTAQKAIAISSAPSTGTPVDPQTLANALNFLDVNPADRSIVLAGSGGSGRSESATLRFRVVDTNNTPVKGVRVAFTAAPANDVTLNIPTATSDAEGVVVTTVSSKTVATAVVIRAAVAKPNGTTITSQSDQLLVTTGVSTQAGFDLSATKYNLNNQITGDSSDITVRIVDRNGNPVADGVPVVFTSDYGRVGSSSRGGCTTVNGQCLVTFMVQDPRPADGVPTSVTGSTRLADGTAISSVIQLQLSSPGLYDLFTASTGGTAITALNLGSSCKAGVSFFVGTPAGSPATAGTTIGVTAITSGVTASVKTGSPIADQLSRPARRTLASIEVDVSAITGATACDPAGAGTQTATVEVKFTSGTITKTLPLNVTYRSS